MPCGWVDISLSITSVGPLYLDFPDVPRRARPSYARDKENRIHRGEILCTAGTGFSLRRVGSRQYFELQSTRPPSTTRTWPVTNSDRTRKTTASAMSDGFPERCSGASLMNSASHSGGSPGIVIVPGVMALTRTSGASAFASTFVSITTPAFETECAMYPGQPSSPPV